ILWPETVIAASPEPPKSTGTWPNAWTASECSGTWNSAATSASSRTGRTVPISLLAHITVARATSSGLRDRASRRASGCTRPWPSTGRYSTVAPSCSPSQWTASRTAWCSTGLARIRVRAGSASLRAQYRPFTARLAASVPPEVNTTSLGRTPRCAVSASTASGSIGVVAAWSRYAMVGPILRGAGHPPRAAGGRVRAVRSQAPGEGVVRLHEGEQDQQVGDAEAEAQGGAPAPGGAARQGQAREHDGERSEDDVEDEQAEQAQDEGRDGHAVGVADSGAVG